MSKYKTHYFRMSGYNGQKSTTTLLKGRHAGRRLKQLRCLSLNGDYSVMSTEWTVGRNRERKVVIRKEYISSFIATRVYMSSFLIQSWRQLKNVPAPHLDISKYEFSWVTCYVVEVDKLREKCWRNSSSSVVMYCYSKESSAFVRLAERKQGKNTES